MTFHFERFLAEDRAGETTVCLGNVGVTSTLHAHLFVNCCPARNLVIGSEVSPTTITTKRVFGKDWKLWS